MTDHIHDCTGPDLTCACGFRLPPPPRFCVSIEVYDNQTHQTLTTTGFNTDGLAPILRALSRAEDAVRAALRGHDPPRTAR